MTDIQQQDTKTLRELIEELLLSMINEYNSNREKTLAAEDTYNAFCASIQLNVVKKIYKKIPQLQGADEPVLNKYRIHWKSGHTVGTIHGTSWEHACARYKLSPETLIHIERWEKVDD